MICFYHNDQDGICSAAIVKLFYNNVEEVKFVSINYDENYDFSTINKNEDVIIVDFSFSLNRMRELYNITKNIVWIDHHNSAIEKLKEFELLSGIRRNGTAACELTWEYYFKNEEMPRVVKLIGDRDVWKFEFGNIAKELYYGIQYDKAFKEPNNNWLNMLNDDKFTNDCIIGGIIIKNAIEDDCIRFLKSNYVIKEWNGFKTLFINKYMDNDLIYENIEEEFDIINMFYYKRNQWMYSLRSRTQNIRKIAELYGGGGHDAAAGFYSNNLIIGDVEC